MCAGLLDAIQRDIDQLAIIVAHEVAHLVARHHSFADGWSLPAVAYTTAGDLFDAFKASWGLHHLYALSTAGHKHACCHASPQ